MSRSTRKPFGYTCSGADPAEGKRITSRDLRRNARISLAQARYNDEIEPRFDIQDRNRGRAGSKARDSGWDFFGDGRNNFDSLDYMRRK